MDGWMVGAASAKIALSFAEERSASDNGNQFEELTN
jgi:hypothetical protein